jgi:hypothetical protein
VTEETGTKPTGQTFINGWFCPKCDRLTEHKLVEGRQVCNECGFALGKPISMRKRILKYKIAILTKKIQELRSSSQHQIEVLEKRLAQAQEELSSVCAEAQK